MVVSRRSRSRRASTTRLDVVAGLELLVLEPKAERGDRGTKLVSEIGTEGAFAGEGVVDTFGGVVERLVDRVDLVDAGPSERRYLLRETHPGKGWMSPAVHGLLALVCLAWALAFRSALRANQDSDPIRRQEPDNGPSGQLRAADRAGKWVRTMEPVRTVRLVVAAADDGLSVSLRTGRYRGLTLEARTVGA